jgi:hypothetical protein
MAIGLTIDIFSVGLPMAVVMRRLASRGRAAFFQLRDFSRARIPITMLAGELFE